MESKEFSALPLRLCHLGPTMRCLIWFKVISLGALQCLFLAQRKQLPVLTRVAGAPAVPW